MASSFNFPKPQPVKMFQVKEKLLRPALTSNFECYIPKTDIAEVDRYYDTQLLSLSCYETALPGSTLFTNESTDDFTGITQRFAYRKSYDQSIDLNFYVDHRDSQGYKIILFFESWIRYITGDDNNNKEDNFNYRVKYPDEPKDPKNDKKNVGYRKEIYLTKFERDFKGDVLTYNFLKAYPIAMSSMPVSYQNSDLLRCRVSFNYDRYVIKTESQSIESEPGQTTPIGIPDIGFPENPEFGSDPTVPQLPGLGQNPLGNGTLGDRFPLGTQPGQINPGSGGLIPDGGTGNVAEGSGLGSASSEPR